MEKKQSVKKARTIASFVKKNNRLFKQSSNSLVKFLCDELSKCKYANYTYRLDNIEIQFFLHPCNSDGRNGGYLWCNVKNIDTDDITIIFTSYEDAITYFYPSLDGERSVLFDWDKIIECMERCF